MEFTKPILHSNYPCSRWFSPALCVMYAAEAHWLPDEQIPISRHTPIRCLPHGSEKEPLGIINHSIEKSSKTFYLKVQIQGQGLWFMSFQYLDSMGRGDSEILAGLGKAQ